MRLLALLGYEEADGAWRHPHRRLIFVGDYIDRGPEQIRTIEIVRAIVASGAGVALMGNHEFNAIAYATPNYHDGFLRPRSVKNTLQHRRFLDEVGCDSACHRQEIAWMRTLPLHLDLPGLRVVHACWHTASLNALAPALGPGGTVREASFRDLLTPGTPLNAAAETLLKGIECDLPPSVSFIDKDGHERWTTRLRWWSTAPLSLRDAALVDEATAQGLPDTALPSGVLSHDDDRRPVFFGHYWMRGAPLLTSSRHACLDFSVAAGGHLCAYRWSGEAHLDQRHLVAVSA